MHKPEEPLRVSGDGKDHAPFRTVQVNHHIPHGKREMIEYDSKTVGAKRKDAGLYSARLFEG